MSEQTILLSRENISGECSGAGEDSSISSRESNDNRIRLAVYGTLRKGGKNHILISGDPRNTQVMQHDDLQEKFDDPGVFWLEDYQLYSYHDVGFPVTAWCPGARTAIEIWDVTHETEYYIQCLEPASIYTPVEILDFIIYTNVLDAYKIEEGDWLDYVKNHR